MLLTSAKCFSTGENKTAFRQSNIYRMSFSNGFPSPRLQFYLISSIQFRSAVLKKLSVGRIKGSRMEVKLEKATPKVTLMSNKFVGLYIIN